MDEELEMAKNILKKLEKEHTWIKDQKQYTSVNNRLFGMEDSQYNFNQYNIPESEKRMKNLHI